MVLFENSLKLVWQVRKKNGAQNAPNLHFAYNLYTPVFSQKQNLLLYFDAGLKHIATWPRGKGSYVDTSP